jgi:ketosteroid isomerase-like protein
MGSANIARHRRLAAVLNADGLDGWLEQDLLSPEIVFYDLPEQVDGGVFRGVEEVVARLRAIGESLGRLRTEVRSLEEQGDCTLANVEFSMEGASSGVPITASRFDIMRWADGRLREWRVYLDGDQARQAFERLSAHGGSAAARTQ